MMNNLDNKEIKNGYDHEVYGLLISEHERGLFISSYGGDLKFGEVRVIRGMREVWSVKEYGYKEDILLYKGGEESLYYLFSKIKIEVCNKNGKAWVYDVDPYMGVIVGSLGTFADLGGKQIIPLEYWDRENILHINKIVSVLSKVNGELLLHVQDKRWDNKIVMFNIYKKRIKEMVLDYGVNHGGVMETHLLGYKGKMPIFITTVYWKYLALNKVKIEGTEVDGVNRKWNSVKVLYNEFPERCVVIASGYNIPPAIYEVNIKEKRGKRIGDINVEGKYFWSLELIRSKKIYEKLKELSE